MNRAFLTLVIFLMAFGSSVYSQIPETFDQAKNMAAEQAKPVLMEFLRPG